jgi:hypothetical protein
MAVVSLQAVQIEGRTTSTTQLAAHAVLIHDELLSG